jgi:hypothetical protein
MTIKQAIVSDLAVERPRVRKFGIFDAMVSIAAIAFSLGFAKVYFVVLLQQFDGLRHDVAQLGLAAARNRQLTTDSLANYASLAIWCLVQVSRSNYFSGVIWCCIQMSRTLILVMTPAFLLVRWIRPRPPLRALLRQPGTVAGLAIALGYLLVTNWLHILFIGLNPRTLPPVAIGGTVAIAWAGLALSRKWEAERSWIDRTGRVLGVAAISNGLLFYTMYGI